MWDFFCIEGCLLREINFWLEIFCKILIAIIGISVEKMPVGTVMGTMYGK